MIGPCVKQRVIATIVTPDGASFIGENECLDAQETCPREGMATGEGYHLCKEVCQQVGHAEIVALAKAGDRAQGSSIYLQGHTYICDACKEACRTAGISEMFVCAPADPSPQTKMEGRDPDLLAALKGAIGALEFSRDYHKDLSNEEQAFAQDRLDAAVRAIAKAEGLAQ